MATGTCVECGTGFEYRLRGSPQVTCSPECRADRKQHQTVARVGRWAVRQAAVGALGYPERLTCRAQPENAAQRPTCEQAAAVLYVDGEGTSYALCGAHATNEARELSIHMGLQRITLPAVPS